MIRNTSLTTAGLSIFMTLPLLSGCLSTAENVEAEPGNPQPPSNSRPTISGSPSSAVMVNEAYSFTPSASDPDGDSLSFSVANLPGWATFNSSNGRISGTPSPGDEGTYSNIRITASDGSLSASLPGFSVAVNTISTGAVTLSWTPPTENEDGTPLTDLAAYKFYYGTSPGSYTNQVRINNPGLASYVIDGLTPNTYYFVATAINASGAESRFSNEAIKEVSSM